MTTTDLNTLNTRLYRPGTMGNLLSHIAGECMKCYHGQRTSTNGLSSWVKLKNAVDKTPCIKGSWPYREEKQRLRLLLLTWITSNVRLLNKSPLNRERGMRWLTRCRTCLYLNRLRMLVLSKPWLLLYWTFYGVDTVLILLVSRCKVLWCRCGNSS